MNPVPHMHRDLPTTSPTFTQPVKSVHPSKLTTSMQLVAPERAS